MSSISILFSVILTIEATNSELPLPIDLNAWWGPIHLKNHNDTGIHPFRIVFDDEMIKDLKYRLWNTRRVAPPLESVGFEYGFNSDQLHPWIKYWAEEYPFKEREEFLNQYPQYVTNIQGLYIHFIHVKPKVYPGKEVVPLLLLHGWPGSVREFYETIPHLTSVDPHRDFAVEVVAPSLPGFGFSDAAVRPGLGATEMGVVFRNLMRRLGFHQFYVQGGDWGAYIGQSIATLFPKDVLGYHTNLAVALTRKAFALTLFGQAFPPAVVEPQLAANDTKSYIKLTICCRIPTPVPTCTIHAKDEILYQSPMILRTKFPNLLNSTNLFDGGHFLALEMPELFADNVLAAIATFRVWHNKMV